MSDLVTELLMQYVYIGGTLVPQRPGARVGISSTKALRLSRSRTNPSPSQTHVALFPRTMA
jgi:hypothetical protein